LRGLFSFKPFAKIALNRLDGGSWFGA